MLPSTYTSIDPSLQKQMDKLLDALEEDDDVQNVYHNLPRVDKITVMRHGKVRRAKLYYMRERFGKAARIKEVRR